jgi:cytochrome c oxidase subunit II
MSLSPDPLPPNWLAPAGPAASDIAVLTRVLLIAGVLIYVAVLGLIGWAIWRPRRVTDSGTSERAGRWLLGAGAGASIILVSLLLIPSLGTLAVVLPRPEAPAAVTVEVTGHQWWWAARYVEARPEDAVETANEIHIPTGVRVAVRLLARDVIHSFWVPQLQGKLDLIPGKVNVTWLQADRPGIYRGLCAEYCGLQHARMGFLIVAQPPDEFAAWLQRQRAPAAEPIDDLARQGQRLFLDRGCAFCHTVRGTTAFFGRDGPDLTHVASRQTLAAVTLTNVGGHLAGWIANPQALKPGNRMPHVPLEPAEFHAVLRYVQGLR